MKLKETTLQVQTQFTSENDNQWHHQPHPLFPFLRLDGGLQAGVYDTWPLPSGT